MRGIYAYSRTENSVQGIAAVATAPFVGPDNSMAYICTGALRGKCAVVSRESTETKKPYKGHSLTSDGN